MELTESFKKISHTLAPVLVILVLYILTVIPHAIKGYGAIKPDLLLICVFYWSIHRPSFMSPFISFMLGLLLDLFSALPLGINAFIFVLSQHILSNQRRVFIGQAHAVSWIGFTVVYLISQILKVGIFMLSTWSSPDWAGILIQMVITVAIFPIVTILLIWSHKVMQKAES